MRPLIGITSGTIYNAQFPFYPYTYGQMHTYTEAVTRAGGTPIIIPISKNLDDAKTILSHVDGVLFSGGNDISPKLYGEEPRHIEERGLDVPRDEFEAGLMRLAIEKDVPVFAICRGMQLLNVVRGGTLYQDILKEVPGASQHDGRKITEDFHHFAHAVALEPGSKLAEILGKDSIKTNTHHHQAVNKLGSELVITGRAEDGIVEAIEDPSKKFLLGVQSHPESLVAAGGSDWQPLFEAFVSASKKS